jgi:hypothetical protein
MCHRCERRLPVFSSHDFMPKDQLDPEFQQVESAMEKGLVLFFSAFLARQKGSVFRWPTQTRLAKTQEQARP